MERKARFSGTWYSADAPTLSRNFNQLFLPSAGRELHSGPPAVGAILPHAGYAYSLRGMSPFFRNAESQGKVLVILSPSHYGLLPPDRLYFGRFTHWETPFGPVHTPYFHNWADRQDPENTTSIILEEATEMLDQEHGLEMFFPFAAWAFPHLQAVVPLLVPRLTSLDRAEHLADTLIDLTKNWGGTENTLWIASSDFTHYGDRFGYAPYGRAPSEQVESKVAELDLKIGDALLGVHAQSPREALARAWESFHSQRPTICGFYSALTLAHISNKLNWEGKRLDYYNSQDIASPTSDFVAYQSLVFHRRES